MTRRRTALVALLATSLLLPAAAVGLPTATAGQLPTDPVASATGGCDDLDPALCLLPFPNDRFTVEDPSTPTGRRVAFGPLSLPSNVAGKPWDPTEWNRNDGFSSGSMVLTFVPQLDLAASFGVPADQREGWAQLEHPQLSLAPDAPIVLVDADTGQRHPYFAELDMHPRTGDDERLLIVRPLVNFEPGHRYVVGLRDLKRADGSTIEAGPAFAGYRDGTRQDDRSAHLEQVMATLGAAGVARDDLHLAWDFTVASRDNITGRALAIRNDAFAALGDTDLADRVVQGRSPDVTIDTVEELDAGASRRITGSVTVPNYLTLPQDLAASAGGPLPQQAPGSRFYYGERAPGPNAVPQVNPVQPTLQATFRCTLPVATVAERGTPATPMLYGHGLLGSKNEAGGGSTARMRERGFMPCGVDWIGMAFEDIANVATILTDMSNFGSLADRAQQGFLNFLYVGRALLHGEGLVTHAAFRGPDGAALFDTDELVYDGNSQGGIMGGAVTALSPDIERAVLGVPGMSYSTLLNRSVDWEGAYGEVAYAAYPDKREQQLLFALLQMLWDRSENQGYADAMTDEPLPGTPTHQVLLHPAYGDYQVANVAAEVLARTVGAAFLGTSLAPGRHWADVSGGRMFGFDGFAPKGRSGKFHPHAGSALVYVDSGNPIPPSTNVPPEDRGKDPHDHPRKDPFAAEQKERFYRDGVVVDVHDGEPYWSDRCPVHDDVDGVTC